MKRGRKKIKFDVKSVVPPPVKVALLNESGTPDIVFQPHSLKSIRDTIIKQHYKTVLKKYPNIPKMTAYSVVADVWGLYHGTVRNILSGCR